jgi:hypothetical protein
MSRVHKKRVKKNRLGIYRGGFLFAVVRDGPKTRRIDKRGKSEHTVLSFIRILRARYRITEVLLVRTIIFLQ